MDVQRYDSTLQGGQVYDPLARAPAGALIAAAGKVFSRIRPSTALHLLQLDTAL